VATLLGRTEKRNERPTFTAATSSDSEQEVLGFLRPPARKSLSLADPRAELLPYLTDLEIQAALKVLVEKNLAVCEYTSGLGASPGLDLMTLRPGSETGQERLKVSTLLPRTIGVAVDGSDQSFRALNYAVQLAQLNNSRILILHVMLLPSHISPTTLSKLRGELSKEVEEIFSKIKGIGENGHVGIETRIVETSTSVVMAIVDFAEREKVDLMVLGTRGTSGIPKLMLGSTAAGVVSFAHCPTLVVR